MVHDFVRPRTKLVVQQVHIPKFVYFLIGGVVGAVVCIVFFFSFFAADVRYTHGVLLFDQHTKDSTESGALLLWIDQTKQVLSMVRLPKDLEYASRKLGYYPLRSVATAYAAHSKDEVDLAADLSFFFRLPIVGFVAGEQTLSVSKYALAQFLFQHCFSRESSLSTRTCLSLLKVVVSPSYVLRTVEFPESAVSGGKERDAKILNRAVYRTWTTRNFSGQSSLLRQYTVAVLNTSTVSGVAGSVAQVLEDFGFSIIQTAQKEPAEKNGYLVVSGDVAASVQTRALLEDIFHLQMKTDDAFVHAQRSDIVVVIGEHDAKLFTP